MINSLFYPPLNSFYITASPHTKHSRGSHQNIIFMPWSIYREWHCLSHNIVNALENKSINYSFTSFDYICLKIFLTIS